MLVDKFAHRSFHAEVKPRAGQTPMSEVKMLKSDPVQRAGAKRRDQGALREAVSGLSAS